MILEAPWEGPGAALAGSWGSWGLTRGSSGARRRPWGVPGKSLGDPWGPLGGSPGLRPGISDPLGPNALVLQSWIHIHILYVYLSQIYADASQNRVSSNSGTNSHYHKCEVQEPLEKQNYLEAFSR